MLDELAIEVADSSSKMPFLDGAHTPAWLIWLACALHAASTSLAECSDVLLFFGVDRTRQAVNYWYHSYSDYCDQGFTAEPARGAVDEKQIQLAEEETVWLYAAIDVDQNVVLHARLSKHRGRVPAETFLRGLKEIHRVADAEFLVDGMAI